MTLTRFCTLFDSAYLTRGVAMLRSLARVEPTAAVDVIAMDERTYEIVSRGEFGNVVTHRLEELERFDPHLAATKSTRTRVEYFWTATPAAIKFSREAAGGGTVTYLDADLFFFSSPAPAFKELGDGSVLIVPHRYAQEYEHLAAASGTFNVEWVSFSDDGEGRRVLEWWRERCLEWCFNRVEDGKLGDQKYLESFPELSPSVRISQHPGVGAAPWNIMRYRLDRSGGVPTLDGEPIVFFHFQSFRLFWRSPLLRLVARHSPRSVVHEPRVVWTADYPISDDELEIVWQPYLAALFDATAEVRAIHSTANTGIESAASAVRALARSRVATLAKSHARRSRA